MNTREQRIAIAEACGWHTVQQNPMYPSCPEKLAGFYKEDSHALCGIPDFLTDLNAMYGAEEEIIARNKMNGFNGYENTLCGIIDNGNCVHATASQKAEAFLKTLDLWE